MPFHPIQLTPNMDAATMVSVVNDNFRQLEAENRTKVIVDENGISRVLEGRDPKGNYVLAVSNKTTDVVKALEK